MNGSSRGTNAGGEAGALRRARVTLVVGAIIAAFAAITVLLADSTIGRVGAVLVLISGGCLIVVSASQLRNR